jgi:tetratricopeptide (TPR) repeat protein
LAETFRRDRRLLLVILFLAFAVRIAYLVDIHDSPYLSYPVLDSFWYDAKAKDVIAGDLLASSGSFRTPLYIYFMAGCYQVFGHGYLAPLVIQALLGAFSCGLLYIIGARLFGNLAGAVAGLGFAVYRMAIYSDGEILPTTFFLVFMLAAVYFVLDSIEGRKIGRALAAGLCLALAFVTRPDVIPFVVVLIIVIFALAKPRAGVRIVLALCVPFVALVLLLGYRNYAAFGEFHVLSPQGAVNLYIGNASYADGKTPVAPPTIHPYHIDSDPSEDSIILGCTQAAAENVGRDLSDREISDYYVRKTFGEINNDFPGWLGLMSRKAYYFFNTYERSDIKLIPRWIEHDASLLKLPLLSYGLVMPLGVVGLALVVVRRRRLAWVVVAGFVGFMLNAIMFFVIWRYRLPAVPFLTILAGYTVAEIWSAARARKYRVLGVILIAAVALSLLSRSEFWDVAREDYEVQYVVNEGALYMKAGDYEKATELYAQAIQMDPANPSPYYFLGKAYATRGLIDESKEVMEKAIALNLSYRPFAHVTLGVALANAGRFEEAAVQFQKALDADGEMGLAAYNLASCLVNVGRYTEAESAFTRAEFLCKEDSEALVGIALGYVKLGRYDRGIDLAQRILREDPHNPEALYAAGLGLEAKGRIGEAVAYFERALRYMPSSQELRRKIRDLKAQQF